MNDRTRTVQILNDELSKLIDLIPECARDDFKEEAYVAGGSIYSVYNNEEPKDIDVFIRTLDLKMQLVTYFKDLKGNTVKFTPTGTIVLGEYKGHRVVVTNNAISIGKYQIILKDIGEPKDVVGAFDYKHNMHYIEGDELKTVDIIFNLDSKILKFNENRARDIVSTIMRSSKYLQRGFTLEDKELAKMLLQLHKVGLTEEEVKLLEVKPNYTSFGSGH